MKFAIPYTRKFNHFDRDDYQLNINYRPNIKALDAFIEKFKDKRINLIISLEATQEFTFEEQRDLTVLQILVEKYSETKIVACFPYYTKYIENKLNEMNIPHYYQEQVKNWSRYRGFLSLNVTDIFIAEELCFDLSAVRIAALENNKNLRCYCNVSQSSWADTPALKTFFIRPLDIQLYGQFIDTFEFYNININILNVMYEVYAIKKHWFGPIKEIITNYNSEEEDERFLPGIFGEKRLDCRLKCIRNNSDCQICNRVVQLSKTLKDLDIFFMPVKEKTEEQDGGERDTVQE